MSFDLHYYPLVYRAGREGDAIPGLQVLSAPAISNRHRQHDLLALLLTVSGDHRYDPEEIEALTLQAGQSFFQVQGSVTRAMQAVADALNKQIFDRNLDRGYEGVRALGALNLAVMHNDWLFLGQVSRNQAVFITAENVEFIAEPADAGEFLGLSRRVQMRLAQMEAQPGDMLLLCEQPPASWNVQNLAGSSELSMIQVKRRLMNQVTGSMETVALKFIEGRGKVLAGKWTEMEAQAQPVQAAPQAASSGRVPEENSDNTGAAPVSPTSQPEFYGNRPSQLPASIQNQDAEWADEADKPEESDLSGEAPTEDEYSPEAANPREDGGVDDIPAVEVEGQIPVLEGRAEDSYSASSPALPGGREKPLAATPCGFVVGLARIWMKLRAANEKVNGFFERLSRRFGSSQPPLANTTPPLMMVILSLAIPLVVVLASITVYTQSGKNEEHQILLADAQKAIAQATEAKDVVQQRAYWAQAVDLLTRAQDYEVTQASQELFTKAQTNLDQLDLAGRLDFRPALTDFFAEGVVLTRIQSASSGVYLLDQTSGSVLRISLNSKGFYELDTEFKCSPGTYGQIPVTALVDFEILPANTDNFRVMGIDAQGDLLYCRPGEVPVYMPLSAPEGGWKRIVGMAYDQDVLYVLDAGADAVWMYEGKNPQDEKAAGVYFSGKPIKFFDEDVPDLGGAVDLTANDDDLYVLHQDGHMSLCRYSALKEVKLTECQDPAPYSDSRAGKEKNPWIFMDSRFELMQRTVAPNASIYILDGANHSINQFSNQLNLEKVWRPQVNRSYPVPNVDPTGFGISTDMEVFLAYHNQLFIAPLE